MFKSKIIFKGRLRKGEEAANEFNDDAKNELGCYDFIFCPILGVTYKRGFRSEGTNKQH